MVNVLVVSPRQHDIVESTTRFVYPTLGLELWIVVIGVFCKRLGVDDLVAELCADDKRVPDDVPLTFCVTKEDEEFAEVVDQSSYLHGF